MRTVWIKWDGLYCLPSIITSYTTSSIALRRRLGGLLLGRFGPDNYFSFPWVSSAATVTQSKDLGFRINRLIDLIWFRASIKLGKVSVCVCVFNYQIGFLSCHQSMRWIVLKWKKKIRWDSIIITGLFDWIHWSCEID